MRRIKEPVRLRERELRNGNTSLYLDIYSRGRRKYEFLNLYLVPEKTRADKEKNKETIRLAEAVKAKRIVEIQNDRFDFESGKQEVRFLDYFRMQCEKRKRGTANSGAYPSWVSTLLHLETFCSPSMKFSDVTPKFILEVREYLNKATSRKGDGKTPLSQTSKAHYFDKFKACIHAAVRDGILQRDPLLGIEGIKKGDIERLYLSIDEVRAMAATECKRPPLKRAFLFACLTGLRRSDVLRLKWGDVHQQGGFTRIIFRQKKTGGQEYIDLTPEAVTFMGERGKPDELVFNDFVCDSYTVFVLRDWAKRAGVMKDITFHSSRHTFAVLMLDLGVDLYTVQKLLGHREIKTTQVYAHILDKKKQQAAMLIPSILPPPIDEGASDSE